MAIEIISGIKSYSRESLDKRSGPYDTLANALAAIPSSQRYVGLPVVVVASAAYDGSGNFISGNVTRYLFDGGIDDVHLVEDATGAGGAADGVLTGALVNENGELVLSFSEGLADIVVDVSTLGGAINRTVADVPPTMPPSVPGEEYIVLSPTIYTV
jgi:hypothetical protein